jgi:hypothetical protein
VFKHVPAALSNLLSAMHVSRNYYTLDFDYDPLKLILKVKIYTSGGIMPGGSMHFKWCGSDCTVTSSGMKGHLMESAMRKLHRIMARIKRGDETAYEMMVAVIKAKYEWKYGQFKSVAELDAMLMKIREFFIPDLPHVYLCILLNEKRMKLERNNVIRIGMKYWHGGAYYLYTYLCGDFEDMIWVDGDIESLDKHISDWLLLLYCAGVYPYYNWGIMTEEKSIFLQKLLEYWASNVCAKAVCHIGSFWRYMCGQMYSGGPETSHGDSWIMAFIFYVYCEINKQDHPHLAVVIQSFMMETIIMIVVYGDDHIWGAPGILDKIMNANTWKSFFKEVF